MKPTFSFKKSKQQFFNCSIWKTKITYRWLNKVILVLILFFSLLLSNCQKQIEIGFVAVAYINSFIR